jgi:ketosteroid isomerase-like protein
VKRALAALLLLASGCKDEAKTPPAAVNAPAVARETAPPARVAPAPRADAPDQADRKDAEALLAAWLAAQNRGDYPAYQALYADRFTGVRRSGVKIRRFDRAGWMADRTRMFKKPMVVAAEALVVIAHGAQTHLFFTQTFEQGTYKDTGRKWMALERTAGGMRIAREEMLDSTLIARQSQDLASAKAGPDGKALAAGDVELGWTGKRDRLYLAPLVEAGDALLIGRASGAIGTGPVTVAEHTTDAASGAVGGVTANRAVDPKKLPAALASRLGKTVQLLDEDLQPLCHATISGYSLTVTDWAPEKASGSPEEAAAALLDDAPVVVAALQTSGCPKGAAYGRDVDLPPLAQVPSLDVAQDMEIRKVLGRATKEDNSDVEVVRVAGSPSKAVGALMAHTEDSCETQEEYRMHLFLLTRKGKRWTAEPLASYQYQDWLRVAVDADGDGTIDVFTELGSHRGDENDFWRHDVAVFWPPGLGCDGCEGPDCGD